MESRLSVDEELTLRLVATRAQRERNHSKIQELVERADLERLRGLMTFQRMPALLGKRLMEATDSLPTHTTAEIEQLITKEHRRAWLKSSPRSGSLRCWKTRGLRACP